MTGGPHLLTNVLLIFDFYCALQPKAQIVALNLLLLVLLLECLLRFDIWDSRSWQEYL